MDNVAPHGTPEVLAASPRPRSQPVERSAGAAGHRRPGARAATGPLRSVPRCRGCSDRSDHHSDERRQQGQAIGGKELQRLRAYGQMLCLVTLMQCGSGIVFASILLTRKQPNQRRAPIARRTGPAPHRHDDGCPCSASAIWHSRFWIGTATISGWSSRTSPHSTTPLLYCLANLPACGMRNQQSIRPAIPVPSKGRG